MKTVNKPTKRNISQEKAGCPGPKRPGRCCLVLGTTEGGGASSRRAPPRRQRRGVRGAACVRGSERDRERAQASGSMWGAKPRRQAKRGYPSGVGGRPARGLRQQTQARAGKAGAQRSPRRGVAALCAGGPEPASAGAGGAKRRKASSIWQARRPAAPVLRSRRQATDRRSAAWCQLVLAKHAFGVVGFYS